MTSIEWIITQLEEQDVTDISFSKVGSSDIYKISGTHSLRRNVRQYRKSTANSRFVIYTAKVSGQGKTIDDAYRNLADKITYEEQTEDRYIKGRK
jgi:hypothetical protein